ncbi:Craniofacial development protein 2 [Blattella germanica]|nr:Craniofacial development protein 2 [Blattella germanica]
MGEYVICNSGSSKRNQFGVGFLIHKSLKSSILQFDPINERLCSLTMKGKFYNTSIICAHAPTEEKEEHIKDQYYDELTRAFKKLNKYDRKIVMGDLNAKLGKNDNGNRLADSAITNNLAVSSTLFPLKTIHKITWQSPDGVTRNQIDHVLIDSRHTRDISDVKTCRGADLDSDHFLIRIKFKPRI